MKIAVLGLGLMGSEIALRLLRQGFDVTGWYGLCTQAKVPQPILAKLNTDANKLLAGPLKKRLEDQGIAVANGATPAQFAAHVKSEIAKWTKVVHDANLQTDR